MTKAVVCPTCAGHEPTLCSSACNGTGRLVRVDADGKVIKPDGWQAPDVAGVLARREWRRE